MYIRLLVVTAILAAGQLLALAIGQGYSMGEVVRPDRDWADLPLQLGGWDGKDMQTDQRLSQFLQARAGIDRRYRNAYGAELTGHFVWTDDYIRVHFPQQCYRESGWTLTRSEPLELKTDNDKSFPVMRLTFERDGFEIHVLYWFQMGDEFFFDRFQHRALRRQLCWGKKRWPPLNKVMLEAPRRQPTGGQDPLQEFAALVYDWMDE